MLDVSCRYNLDPGCRLWLKWNVRSELGKVLPPRRRTVGVDPYQLKRGQQMDLSFAKIDYAPKVSRTRAKREKIDIRPSQGTQSTASLGDDVSEAPGSARSTVGMLPPATKPGGGLTVNTAAPGSPANSLMTSPNLRSPEVRGACRVRS